MSHFNVSLIVWAKSQNGVHKPHILKRKESRSGSNRGPSAYQPSALPLGHTGALKKKKLKGVRFSLHMASIHCHTLSYDCYGRTQALTSPSDSILRLIGTAHARLQSNTTNTVVHSRTTVTVPHSCCRSRSIKSRIVYDILPSRTTQSDSGWVL